MIPLWMLKMFGMDRLLALAITALEIALAQALKQMKIEIADNHSLSLLVSDQNAMANIQNPQAEGAEKLKKSVGGFLNAVGIYSLEIGGDTRKAAFSGIKAGAYALATAVFMRDAAKQ